MIKWKAILFEDGEIMPVECTKETATSVYFSGVGEFGVPKKGEHAAFFDTWEEAHAYLIKKAEKKLVALSLRVGQSLTTIAKIKQMSAPVQSEVQMIEEWTPVKKLPDSIFELQKPFSSVLVDPVTNRVLEDKTDIEATFEDWIQTR